MIQAAKMEKRFKPQNYMGASFQTPHAAPRERQMEMHHDQ